MTPFARLVNDVTELTRGTTSRNSLVERCHQHVEPEVELVPIQQQRVSDVPLQHHLPSVHQNKKRPSNEFGCRGRNTGSGVRSRHRRGSAAIAFLEHT